MKYLFNILFFILIGNFCLAQHFVSKGDSLREKGKLEEAILAYKEVYKTSPNKKDNTYNLACAYALTFQKDSAFYYLKNALITDSTLWALADTDLYALIDDTRWETIEKEQLNKFQKENGALKQPEYAKQLLNIILKDQALDYYVDQGKKFYMENGTIPQWYYPIGYMKQIIAQDNYSNIQSLTKKYGWPKYSKVGKLAADAPLLVINHHPDDSVRKKYIEQIKQTCLEGEGSCIEYAKIQDRILVNDGKPQIYGMQFKYGKDNNLEPFPIVDPEHVDLRRKKIGLGPLKDYLKRKINYDWTVVQKND